LPAEIAEDFAAMGRNRGSGGWAFEARRVSPRPRLHRSLKPQNWHRRLCSLGDSSDDETNGSAL